MELSDFEKWWVEEIRDIQGMYADEPDIQRAFELAYKGRHDQYLTEIDTFVTQRYQMIREQKLNYDLRKLSKLEIPAKYRFGMLQERAQEIHGEGTFTDGTPVDTNVPEHYLEMAREAGVAV
jgi:hypothetical protein